MYRNGNCVVSSCKIVHEDVYGDVYVHAHVECTCLVALQRCE